MEFFTFEWITDPEIWASLITLMALEIVLVIDNLVFISILASRLPEHQQSKARKVGLALALVSRLLLLATLAWIVGLTAPFVTIGKFGLSWRDVILIAGGLFLLWKATVEIHAEMEGAEDEKGPAKAATTFGAIVTQIAIIDIVFSLDSVITAVGMADQLGVMITAVVVAVGVMMVSAGAISAFVDKHPTVKMLALSFLLLIGVSLVAEGFHQHIPKGYIYFAMGFSIFVEMINLRIRAMRDGAAKAPVELRQRY